MDEDLTASEWLDHEFKKLTEFQFFLVGISGSAH